VSLYFYIMSDKLKILCVPANEGGCAYYRIISPMQKVQELYGNDVELRWNKNPLGIIEEGEGAGQWQQGWTFEDMKWADIVFTQNLSNFGGQYTARIVGKAKEFGKFVHYDTDDLLTNIYEGHRLYDVYKEKGLEEITKFIYQHSDLVTVTQRKFAERVAPYCSSKNTLAVVKNTVDYNLPCWNLERVPKPRKKYTRFGWAGGIHHEQDLQYFAGVPHFVNQRVGRENCVWDFYGHPPPQTPKGDWQYDVWRRYKDIILRGFKGGKNWNIHYALTPDRYGQFFTNMDIALAPLEMNEFNDSKSEIKVAECGRYKIPLVASNVGCYDEWIIDGETGFLIDPEKGVSEWTRILSRCAKDPKLVKRMGENLFEVTEANFDMNKEAGKRLDLYREAMSVSVS
jgi:glycosyltransferase involved in cell wall biosynthesis